MSTGNPKIPGVSATEAPIYALPNEQGFIQFPEQILRRYVYHAVRHSDLNKSVLLIVYSAYERHMTDDYIKKNPGTWLNIQVITDGVDKEGLQVCPPKAVKVVS